MREVPGLRGPYRGKLIAAASVVALALAFMLSAAASAAGQVRAGVASVDASWHVGAGAGQYSPEGSFFNSPQGQGADPHRHSRKQEPTYGLQSRLKVRALVVEGPDGKRVAFVKNDLYIAQDLLWRRAKQLIEAGPSGVDGDAFAMSVSHNHSSPYYSSTAPGAWAFEDVFDERFYAYYARRMADAVEKAAATMVPVRVGGAMSNFDKTARHSFGPAKADDGTPAGYPVSDPDQKMTVVRFDDISDPSNPKPLANIVNYALHPEFLDGNSLISADFIGPLERMADRRTKALTIFTQGATGTSEPERSAYHPVRERLEFTHKEYAQAEYGASLMAREVVDTWEDIERGATDDSNDYAQYLVPFKSDFPVKAEDRFYPGPVAHPAPTVSNCRADSVFTGDPRVPIVGLPDCTAIPGLSNVTGPFPLKLTTDDFQRMGIPVPENYGAVGYGALEEDVGVHLQSFRLGDILFTICSCEQWKDQSENIRTRTDRVQGNQYNGYDWSDRCTQVGGPGGNWECMHPSGGADGKLGGPGDDPITDYEYRRMVAQVNNPANGWNDLDSESEPADPAKIEGNYTHDDMPDNPDDVTDPARASRHGYGLTVPIGMANDYNGYIPSYREYQRGDHYRKALAAWGPHSSDYMATRLIELGRKMMGGGYLVEDEPLSPKETADQLNNEQRAQVLGTAGEASDANEEQSSGAADGGNPGSPVEQPRDIRRFNAAFFKWNGGNNYVDNPNVKVQRCFRVQCRSDSDWRDFADQTGEVQTTMKYPTPPTPGATWTWTAHFEAFASRYDLFSPEGVSDAGTATPPGTYRFVVDGRARKDGATKDYQVKSDPFTVTQWDGIRAEDVRREPDGTVSFRVGPRREIPMPGFTPATTEIGPIDYPDSYAGDPYAAPRKAAFIKDERSFVRDPEAPTDPAKVEWYCLECSFRPWLDAGDAVKATVTFVDSNGFTREVAATEQGGRWRTSETLGAGGSAYVGAGCVQDAFANYNGTASARTGSEGPTNKRCAVPGPEVEPNAANPGGPGAGNGGGTGNGGGRRNQQADRCAPAVGSIRGKTLGRAVLGRSRAVQRRAFPGAVRRKTVDRSCLRGGGHIRIGYLSARQRRKVMRSQARGERAVLILTTSRRYAIKGVRHGSTRTTLKRRVRGLRSFKIGKNRWYIARGSKARLVFKVRGGRVQEVGLAEKGLTRRSAAARRFLGSFD